MIFAEIDPAKAVAVKGRKASGKYRLRIELSPLVQPRASDQQVHLVWLAGALAQAGNELCLLQLVERCGVITATTAYDDAQVVLGADLDHRQVKALNEARALDGSLTLNLQTWGLAQGPSGLQSVYGADGLRVASEAWQRFLEETDFAEIVAVEVVAPKCSTPPELTNAAAALRLAKRKLLLERRPNEAVADCRQVLDAIRFDPPLPLGLELGPRDRLKGLTLDERMALLAYALRHVTHVPHHGDHDLRPQDAQLVVTLTALLLAREIESQNAPETA